LKIYILCTNHCGLKVYLNTPKSVFWITALFNKENGVSMLVAWWIILQYNRVAKHSEGLPLHSTVYDISIRTISGFAFDFRTRALFGRLCILTRNVLAYCYIYILRYGICVLSYFHGRGMHLRLFIIIIIIIIIK